jgi:hypothetical protein
MGRIVDAITDPAWWFTTVFVALLLAIAGPRVDALFRRILSGTSERFRRYSANKAAKEKELIEELSNDDTRLIVAAVTYVGDMVLASTTAILSLLAALSAGLAESGQLVDSQLLEESPWSSTIAAFGFLICAFIFGFRGMGRSTRMLAALKLRKERRKNLPG